MTEKASLECLFTKDDNFLYANVMIPASFVSKIHMQASEFHQEASSVLGFNKGQVPLSYISETFKPHIIDHLKEFFYKYFVINWLYKSIYKQKICVAGEPILTNITLTSGSPASYSFSLTLAPALTLQGWKRLSFKPPKRKNYKDLDRQVISFLKKEEELKEQHLSDAIQVNDWVLFSVTLLDKDHRESLDGYNELLWIKVGHEEADRSIQALFIGKKIGDSFVTHEQVIQVYFSAHFETHYPYCITIVDFLPCAFFCIEHFKKHFRLKNSKELHQKCIEVFSYRNDISQRRATVEELLRLLLAKNPFKVSSHLILRQEKSILDMISINPDYQVYKMQSDFKFKVRQLAEKQVKEHVLMHQLALCENLEATDEDVKSYLNLLTRPRTTEFVYFEPPQTKFSGQEFPISATLLSECCLREKALNHAIFYLSKNC